MLSKFLRLNHSTISKSLKRLQDLTFVLADKRQWKAIKPPDGALKTFNPKIVKHWSDEFVYVKLRLPRLGFLMIATVPLRGTVAATIPSRKVKLSFHHCELFSRLEGTMQKGKLTSKAGLARFMGLSRPTINRLCADLQAFNIFAFERINHLSRIVWKATDRHYQLFMAGVAQSLDYEALGAAQRQIYDHCRANKLTQNLTTDKLMELIDLGSKLDFSIFAKMAKVAKSEHKKNNGDLQYGNLLLHKLQNNQAADRLMLHQRNGQIITAP